MHMRVQTQNNYVVYDLLDNEVCLGVFTTNELCVFLGKSKTCIMSRMRQYQEKSGTPKGTVIFARRYLVEKWSGDDGS